VLPCSSGEGQALRIAASVADGVPVDLREAVTSLDGRNAVPVAAVVLHAAGHRGVVAVFWGEWRKGNSGHIHVRRFCWTAATCLSIFPGLDRELGGR